MKLKKILPLFFEVADADGLHQIQLSVPITDKDRREIVEIEGVGLKLLSCQP